MSESAAQPRAEPAANPGLFSRFLWFCAGADGSLLRRCPTSDWVKYESIGGIVLATTVLAFVSSSYAFYTVFSPKNSTALEATLDPTTAASATLAGLLWAPGTAAPALWAVVGAAQRGGASGQAWSWRTALMKSVASMITSGLD